MQELDDKRNYVPIFEVDGFNLLLSDLIMRSYGRYGQVELCEQGHIREYSNKAQWSAPMKEGLELYSSAERCAAYLAQLTQLFDDNAKSLSALANSGSDKSSASAFFNLAKAILDEYAKLSPMFTDEISRRAGKNSVIAQNLARAEQAKERHRQSISKLFLEDGSPLSLLVATIAGVNKVDEAQVWWSTIAEAASGKLPSDISGRQLAFVQIGGGNTTNYFGAEASKRIRQFDGDLATGTAVIGTVASRGRSDITKGRVKVINLNYADMESTRTKIEEMHQGDILVSQTTSPELMEACRKAAAIVTDVGGVLSHAAIVSREFAIPCIVGAGNASRTFSDGDIVEVNTNDGTVRLATY